MNIVLIVVDTWRADHLSTYGYARPTSPYLSYLACRGARFACCYAQANATEPSFTTILTGRHPLNHGIVGHLGSRRLAPSVPLLAEVLQANGFATGAVDSLGGWFERGFDTYRRFTYHQDWVVPPRSGETLNDAAILLLTELCATRRPFFLFLHYWDPHTPYLPPSPFDRLFPPESGSIMRGDGTLDDVYAFDPLARYMRDWIGDLPDVPSVVGRYDGELAYLDTCLARLLATIERLDVARDTLVVVTGDHGESLNEHGIFFDHRGLYEPSLRVPLVLSWPGILPAGRVVNGIARHLDIVPTLLDYAGLTGTMATEGVSLRPRIERRPGPTTDTVLACESTWRSALSLRFGSWKLIWQRPYEPESTFELYDLTTDPFEVRDLASERSDVVEAMSRHMQAMVQAELALGGHALNPMQSDGLTLRSLYNESSSPEELRGQVIELLQDQGKLIPSQESQYSAEEEALINDRLRNLGYL